MDERNLDGEINERVVVTRGDEFEQYRSNMDYVNRDIKTVKRYKKRDKSVRFSPKTMRQMDKQYNDNLEKMKFMEAQLEMLQQGVEHSFGANRTILEDKYAALTNQMSVLEYNNQLMARHAVKALKMNDSKFATAKQIIVDLTTFAFKNGQGKRGEGITQEFFDAIDIEAMKERNMVPVELNLAERKSDEEIALAEAVAQAVAAEEKKLNEKAVEDVVPQPKLEPIVPIPDEFVPTKQELSSEENLKKVIENARANTPFMDSSSVFATKLKSTTKKIQIPDADADIFENAKPVGLTDEKKIIVRNPDENSEDKYLDEEGTVFKRKADPIVIASEFAREAARKDHVSYNVAENYRNSEFHVLEQAKISRDKNKAMNEIKEYNDQTIAFNKAQIAEYNQKVDNINKQGLTPEEQLKALKEMEDRIKNNGETLSEKEQRVAAEERAAQQAEQNFIQSLRVAHSQLYGTLQEQQNKERLIQEREAAAAARINNLTRATEQLTAMLGGGYAPDQGKAAPAQSGRRK